MRKSYPKRPCRFCQKPITVNGYGRVSHGRKHVRNGDVFEYRDRIGLIAFAAIGEILTHLWLGRKGFFKGD